MADTVVVGSATKLNALKGYSRAILFSADDITARGEKVYEAGILLYKADGTIYFTDGKTKLKDLKPIVDQSIAVLTAVERNALATAFESGVYVAKEGGVLVAGADGKLADTSLNLIDTDGKIKDSYLKMIGSDGKISLDYLPDSVRAHVFFVATYADLDTVSDEEKKGLVVVADASGDPTVNSGWAEYLWKDDAWIKVAEGESLDVDVNAFFTHDNVESTGAVMYDHPVAVAGITLSEIDTLTAGA